MTPDHVRADQVGTLARRVFVAITVALVVPKCVLCALAYAGAAYAVATAPELCGQGTASPAAAGLLPIGGALLLTLGGLAWRLRPSAGRMSVQTAPRRCRH